MFFLDTKICSSFVVQFSAQTNKKVPASQTSIGFCCDAFFCNRLTCELDQSLHLGGIINISTPRETTFATITIKQLQNMCVSLVFVRSRVIVDILHGVYW